MSSSDPPKKMGGAPTCGLAQISHIASLNNRWSVQCSVPADVAPHSASLPAAPAAASPVGERRTLVSPALLLTHPTIAGDAEKGPQNRQSISIDDGNFEQSLMQSLMQGNSWRMEIL